MSVSQSILSCADKDTITFLHLQVGKLRPFRGWMTASQVILVQTGTENRFLGWGGGRACSLSLDKYNLQNHAPSTPNMWLHVSTRNTDIFFSRQIQGTALRLDGGSFITPRGPQQPPSVPRQCLYELCFRELFHCSPFCWCMEGPWRPWPALGPIWGQPIGADHSTLRGPPCFISRLFCRWIAIHYFKYTGG